ncbi:hypothetical protein FOZ63_027769 [Perkinsus olseni]|uniref:Peptidase A1 domain-containing protein n=1 Tax=Perkinsus olseni TaxID=32597 RepID=A0A7J6TBD5_PEROL|nr:hypothetical protein FOZ63_027769 [Perkinsus olseni]
MKFRKSCILIAPLRVWCSIKLPVFYEEGFLRTELILGGEAIHLVVDTGSVSFHVVGQNFFPHWCQHYPYNCYELSPDELKALKKRKGKTRGYVEVEEKMRPMEGQVEVAGMPKPASIGMRLYVVVRAKQRTKTGSWESDQAMPEASLGLGPPREKSDTFLAQLVEHGVINHPVFTLKLPAGDPGRGELTLGRLESKEASEAGNLVYLPIGVDASNKRKWAVMLSSITARGRDEIDIKSLAVVDSGAGYIAGPPEEAGKLISAFFKRADKAAKRVVLKTTTGYHYLRCDDAKYLPDLELKFSTGVATANALFIRGEMLVQKTSRGKGELGCEFLITERVGSMWTLGRSLFRNRTVRFDAQEGKIGLVLEASSQEERSRIRFSRLRMLFPGSKHKRLK